MERAAVDFVYLPRFRVWEADFAVMAGERYTSGYYSQNYFDPCQPKTQTITNSPSPSTKN